MRIGGATHVLRPSFGALVAAEAELGPLFALVERAADGRLALGGMGASLGMPSRFGLCGGMSFAAAGYYLAAKAVPPDTRPPGQGTSLYNYIYARQAASNGFLGSMGIKFVEWMQLPDDEVRRRTADELPAIAAALERGEPVVIGEVLQSAGGGKAWENHQVLGFAVSRADGETRISIYDPNFPRRDDVAILVKADGSVWRVGGGRKNRDMRGIFRMAYERAEPK